MEKPRIMPQSGALGYSKATILKNKLLPHFSPSADSLGEEIGRELEVGLLVV